MRKILAISKTRPQDTRSYTHIHIHGSGSLLPRMRDTFYRNLSFWWILNPLYHTRTCKESRECVCQVFKVLSLAASRCKTRIMLFYWKWKSQRRGEKNKQVKVREICTPYRFLSRNLYLPAVKSRIYGVYWKGPSHSLGTKESGNPRVRVGSPLSWLSGENLENLLPDTWRVSRS